MCMWVNVCMTCLSDACYFLLTTWSQVGFRQQLGWYIWWIIFTWNKCVPLFVCVSKFCTIKDYMSLWEATKSISLCSTSPMWEEGVFSNHKTLLCRCLCSSALSYYPADSRMTSMNILSLSYALPSLLQSITCLIYKPQLILFQSLLSFHLHSNRNKISKHRKTLKLQNYKVKVTPYTVAWGILYAVHAPDCLLIGTIWEAVKAVMIEADAFQRNAWQVIGWNICQLNSRRS